MRDIAKLEEWFDERRVPRAVATSYLLTEMIVNIPDLTKEELEAIDALSKKVEPILTAMEI